MGEASSAEKPDARRLDDMQRSKVATLPRARRDELKRGYRDGHFTIDEALEWIRRKKPDADISRSGVIATSPGTGELSSGFRKRSRSPAAASAS